MNELGRVSEYWPPSFQFQFQFQFKCKYKCNARLVVWFFFSLTKEGRHRETERKAVVICLLPIWEIGMDDHLIMRACQLSGASVSLSFKFVKLGSASPISNRPMESPRPMTYGPTTKVINHRYSRRVEQLSTRGAVWVGSDLDSNRTPNRIFQFDKILNQNRTTKIWNYCALVDRPSRSRLALFRFRLMFFKIKRLVLI